MRIELNHKKQCEDAGRLCVNNDTQICNVCQVQYGDVNKPLVFRSRR